MDKVHDAISALVSAQSEFKVIGFDKTNPHFKSKFASLTAIVEHISPILAKNDLAISHHINIDGENLVLRTRLFHKSGTTLETEVPLILAKRDMQSLGSAVTYAKRYAISALLNLVTDEDDDGNHASKPSDEGNSRANEAAPKTINNPTGKIITGGKAGAGKASLAPSFDTFGSSSFGFKPTEDDVK